MRKICSTSFYAQSRNRSLSVGAILGVVVGLIAFAPVWLRHNGQYMEYGDYFLQYVPFIKDLKRMVLSGSLSWSWNSFLGDGFIGAYSYYTVFNPFAWLVALFPDDLILFGTMFATSVKLAVSVIGAMLFMRHFCKKDSSALIGALLYTFSGFTLVNTNFYFFLDVVAVFPFVLYGLERLIRYGKGTVYVFSLMLNAAINYYFFVSTVFLVIIYAVFRLELYKLSSWKLNYIYIYILHSIIGTGLAGIALIPSFYAILSSGKATETIGSGMELIYYPQKILEHLRTLVAPIESGRYHAFYDSSTWSSTGVYLPVFGCICVLQWCICKKDWLKKVCVVLTICYFVPVLNAAFNLFSSTAYTRWLYGMALIFSLVTAVTLEEVAEGKQKINQKLLTAVTIFTSALLLVPAIVYVLDYFGISIINRFASACDTEFFMGYSSIAVMLILTAANYVLLWLIAAKKHTIKTITLIVVAACALNYGVYNEINYDLHATDYSNNYYYEKALIEGVENDDDSFEYRIDYPSQIANYSLFKNMPSVNYYNSLQNSGSSRFAQAVGIGESVADTILETPSNGGGFTDALLSVKYYYDYDGNSILPNGFRYVKTENGVDIYENENYIPMGFVYNNYCLEEQLSDMNPEEKAALMLRTMVIQKEDEETVRSYLSAESDINATVDIEKAVADRRETVCSSFAGTSDGFTAEITLDRDNIVFFSIPNDNGWEITVNGEPAKILEVNYGLSGICCRAGSNQIKATYRTPGWNLGLACSVVSLSVWLIFEIIRKKQKYNVV